MSATVDPRLAKTRQDIMDHFGPEAKIVGGELFLEDDTVVADNLRVASPKGWFKVVLFNGEITVLDSSGKRVGYAYETLPEKAISPETRSLLYNKSAWNWHNEEDGVIWITIGLAGALMAFLVAAVSSMLPDTAPWWIWVSLLIAAAGLPVFAGFKWFKRMSSRGAIALSQSIKKDLRRYGFQVVGEVELDFRNNYMGRRSHPLVSMDVIHPLLERPVEVSIKKDGTYDLPVIPEDTKKS